MVSPRSGTAPRASRRQRCSRSTCPTRPSCRPATPSSTSSSSSGSQSVSPSYGAASRIGSRLSANPVSGCRDWSLVFPVAPSPIVRCPEPASRCFALPPIPVNGSVKRSPDQRPARTANGAPLRSIRHPTSKSCSRLRATTSDISIVRRFRAPPRSCICGLPACRPPTTPPPSSR